MYREVDNEEFAKRFRLICRNCGSENCVISGDSGWTGSGTTAGDSATLVIGCNDCKKNDWQVWGPDAH